MNDGQLIDYSQLLGYNGFVFNHGGLKLKDYLLAFGEFFCCSAIGIMLVCGFSLLVEVVR